MNTDALKEILESHQKWLNNEPGGKQADLRGADLRGADLAGADLSRVDLSRVDLSGAYLTGAYLAEAKLTGATLRMADLHGADLHEAKLDGDKSEADLRDYIMRSIASTSGSGDGKKRLEEDGNERSDGVAVWTEYVCLWWEGSLKDCDTEVAVPITHWMPLPEAPEVE